MSRIIRARPPQPKSGPVQRPPATDSELEHSLASLRAGHALSDLLDRARDDLTDLAMELARRIVGRELETRPELVEQWAQELLVRARRARTATLSVHPADAGPLRTRLDALRASCPWLEQLQLREDAALERGGCLLHTPLGTLDARLEVKLEMLVRALQTDA